MSAFSGSHASLLHHHGWAAVMMLLVFVVHAEAKSSGAGENNLGTKPLLKKEAQYHESRVQPPGWMQQPPQSAEALVAESKTSEPAVEGRLAFAFQNSTLGFGELRLKAGNGWTRPVLKTDCAGGMLSAGDDCSWKFVPKAGVVSKLYGQVQVKKDACPGTGGAGEYTCCLSWKSIPNDHQGPSTNPTGLGEVEVTKCKDCGEFCEWCREMNPPNHPMLDTSRSLVRLSPSHREGPTQYCSDACLAASRDATPQLRLRETDKGDTAGFWDCRMEFLPL